MRMISRLRALRGAALAAFVLTAGSAIADPQAIRYYEDAVSRFNSGDAKGAMVQLQNTLRLDPTQLPARVLMARVQLSLGNPLQAEEELLHAEKLGADPTLIAVPLARARNLLGKHQAVIDGLFPNAYPPSVRADLWVELAKARLGVKDRRGAEAALATAFRLEPAHEEGLLTQIRQLVQARKFDEAESLINDVLSRYPENVDAWYLMGTAQQARGQIDGALAHYRQALALDADHVKAAVGEALALVDAGRPAEAAERLGKIVEQHPYTVEAHFFRYKLLKQLGRDAAAAQALDQATDLVSAVSPSKLGNNTGDLLLGATVATEGGQFELAYGYLSRYIELAPEDLDAKRQLASLLLRLEKASDAVTLLTRLKIDNPDDPSLLVMLGDASAELGDFPAAERYYQLALRMVKADPRLIGRLGMSQLRQGDTEDAIETFERLTNTGAGAGVKASLFLGMLYLSERRFEDARNAGESVLVQQPNNLAAMNFLAAVAGREGNAAEARRIFTEVLARSPSYRAARINLIKLDIAEGDYASAQTALQGLLAEDPDDQLALRELARVFRNLNDHRQAIAVLEQIRKLNPRAVAPILDLMNLYLATGRANDALKVAQTLARDVPNNLEVTNGLALVRLAQGENVIAQSLLNQSVKLARRDVRALRSVARLQVRAGVSDAAEATLQKALVEQPDASGARLDLAALIALRGAYDEAVNEIAIVLDADPNNPVALVLLGDIRVGQGRVGEAIELYRQGLSVSEQPQYIIALYEALLRLGQTDQALEELLAWNQRYPDQPKLMLALAEHYRKTGVADESLRVYQRLEALQPNNVVVLRNFAAVISGVDTEKAMSMALRAYALAPEDAEVLDTLGWMQVQLGDLENGLSRLREAAARNSTSPTIRYHLAVALDEYGSKEEAIRELTAALRSKRPFPDRQSAVQKLELLQTQ